ncbi:DUF1850 domain-containing protein [Moraxella bovis]|uniref:DUF1850 domain-containing protein n=2 Tax=Moraxella bovis TaxID=476 RepID=A0AAQ2T3I9_MORBO|nr:DUF1850 domain-containing protein [Moraxella bovis]AWY20912.1 DUF1850 domain-containing protein [Moraxella bovis]UYZ76424.1 DUF1850 domain-containing protein [Moraxella bovis]UYZ81866.1 DUF1850 domain-containing protein [Moraxella bovis]UYZ86110.1 DUF1850 domain-containing protein [Moraxella bovis]UYZ91543.1 DUF1850 domain-containing protein [Moraxella bovis]
MAMVILCLMGIFTPTNNAVILTADTHHHTLARCRLPDGFILKWRHSVEKQYWQEVYELDKDILVLTKTYIQTFGAGVPSTGKTISAPEGYVGQLINQSTPQISWIVSTNMQGEILSDTQTLSLYKIVPEYSQIHISPEQVNFWQFYHIPSCLKQQRE